MLRLIFNDLRLNLWQWFGPLVVITAASSVIAFFAALLETGAASGGNAQSLAETTTRIVLPFSAVSAIVILNSVSNLSVALQHRDYALWQLVGIQPKTISMIVLSQLLILSIVGSIAGCLIMRPLIDPLFHFFFDPGHSFDGFETRFGPVSIIFVMVGVIAIVLLSGARGARRAARVPAIQALREPSAPRSRMGWLSSLLAVGTLIGIVSLVNAMFHQSNHGGITGSALLLGLLLSAFIASAAPLFLPAVVQTWTALVPERLSAAWYLARHAARFKVSQTSAAISPLMIGISLTGTAYTVTATGDNAQHIRHGTANNYYGDIPIEQVTLLLGGPLILAAFGVAATIFISGRSRDRELALIRASGSTNGTITAVAILEAVIHVVTATILGLLVVFIVGVVTALALSADAPGTLPSFALAPISVVAGVGFLLVLLATVLPTIASLRRDVPELLAAE